MSVIEKSSDPRRSADVVMGAYFTSKPDPQRPALSSRASVSEYTYFWRLTCNALGLPVVLFTDADAGEAKQLESNLCSVGVLDIKSSGLSANDERFVVAGRYLAGAEHDRVLMSDTGDVLFKANPFDFMVDRNCLYFGKGRKEKVVDGLFMVHKMALLNRLLPPERRFIRHTPFLALLSNPKFIFRNRVYSGVALKLMQLAVWLFPGRKRETIWGFQFVNAGLVGGTTDLVLNLLNRINKIFSEIESGENLNTAVLNYILWRDGDLYFSGSPLTNRFKSYDLTGGEYVFHK